jgi:hypothetical protein
MSWWKILNLAVVGWLDFVPWWQPIEYWLYALGFWYFS